MSTYFAAYFTFLIVALISYLPTSKDKRNKIISVAGFIIFATILCLRHPSMGSDLHYGQPHGYLGMYETISATTWPQTFSWTFKNYERGYVILNKLLGCISSDSQLLLIVCGIICIGSLTMLIYKYSNLPLLSYIIYLGLPCFLLNFSGLRQAIAISLTLCSFRFIYNKKPVNFVVLVLFATFFHSSALIFLVAYPCYYFRTERLSLKILSVLLLPIFFIFRYPIFIIASKLFKENALPDNNSAVTLFIVFCFIYLFALIFENKTSKHEVGYRNLFYIACMCQAFGGVYSTVIRVGYYFMIYLVLLLPELISPKNKPKIVIGTITISLNSPKISLIKDSPLVYIAIFSCFALYGLYSLSLDSWPMTNPYSFFWQ